MQEGEGCIIKNESPSLGGVPVPVITSVQQVKAKTEQTSQSPFTRQEIDEDYDS